MTNYHKLYFHGGPGFNSYAEEKILGPLFSKEKDPIDFWNEPSRFRPDGVPFYGEHAYSGLVASARSFIKVARDIHSTPLTVICHSFAANPIYKIAVEELNLIDEIVLIAPAFNIKDSADMRSCFEVWAAHGAPLDFESHGSVMEEFKRSPRSAAASKKLSIPTRVIFGQEDRVVDVERETATCRDLFDSPEIIFFENSAHFPHLEEPGRFVEIVSSKERPWDPAP